MMFRKLTSSWLSQRPTPGQLLQQYTEEGDDRGIRYWSIQQSHPLWQIIRPDRRHLWSMSLMTITASIPPHTDSGARTVINCYGETADAVTYFHTQRQQTLTQRQVRNQTTGHLYDPQELTVTAEFTAQPGEMWMLAVDHIHSVSTKSTEERWAICLSTDQPIQQAEEDLL
jgi:hypothetical protein